MDRALDAAEQAEMEVSVKVDGQNVEADGTEKFAAVGLVEDVVMQTAVLEVIQRAVFECIEVASGWIPAEVVLFEDFGKMSEVVFRRVALEVFQHVRDRCRRAQMIEGIAIEGKDEDESATRAQDALPFAECFDGVGEVLEIVRRKDEVVAGGCDWSELRAVADNVAARRLVGAEDELGGVVGPDGVAGKVAVVQRAQAIVEGQRAFGSK
jgi:hypothetical protein